MSSYITTVHVCTVHFAFFFFYKKGYQLRGMSFKIINIQEMIIFWHKVLKFSLWWKLIFLNKNAS